MHTQAINELFQREFSRMVAVISKRFGLEHIETAEDIVSDTFLLASETWARNGVPENPEGWLYTVAKNKTLTQIRRKSIFDTSVVPEYSSRIDVREEPEFTPENIADSELRMLFAICHPSIGSEAQIGLALRILCGFGIDEIAHAFLCGKETINKRLYRAKEKLRQEHISLEMPAEQEIPVRLDAVLHTLYLLFNEGYYSRTQDQILRKELCLEALRLALTLTDHAATDLPKTSALIALMCFHASRFGARDQGSMILYDLQDEELWDNGLIRQGMHFLERSAAGNEISSYHLEAKIAYRHCTKTDTDEKWREILGLYDALLLVNFSPAAALNRLYAFYRVHGAQAALREAEHWDFAGNHFYYVLLAELYSGLDPVQAKHNFEKAASLARTETERRGIRQKLDALRTE